MNKRWTVEENKKFIERAFELAESRVEKPCYVLAEEFKLTNQAVKDKLSYLKEHGKKVPDFGYAKSVSKLTYNDDGIKIINPKKEIPKNPYAVDQIYDELYGWFGAKTTIKPHPIKKRAKGKIRTTLFCGDLHTPFENTELLQHYIKLPDIDTCIVAGDFFDMHSASRFIKYKFIDPREEFSRGIALMKLLSQAFPEIIILGDNHGKRIEKTFRQIISLPLLEAMLEYDLVKLNVLEHFARPFPNIKIAKSKYNLPAGGGELQQDFFIKYNDIICGHFESYSKVKGRVLENVNLWLTEWSNVLGFTMDEIKMILIAHTHKQSRFPVRMGKVIYGEIGCSCQIQDYTFQGRINYTPQISGYWLAQQDNGHSLLNDSRDFIWS